MTARYISYQIVYPNKKRVTIKEYMKIVNKYGKVIDSKDERDIENELSQKYKYGEGLSEKIYKYSEDKLNKESITWEQAIERFSKTDEYKKIMESYAKDYEKLLGEKSTFVKTVTKGIEIGSGLVPETYGEAVTELH